MRTLLITCFLLMLSGCTAITSKDLIRAYDKSVKANGIYYTLPHGHTPFQLRVVPAEGIFKLALGREKYVSSSKHQFLLRYLPKSNYNDDIKITVNKNGFLSKVTADVDDRSGEIAVDLAKSISGPVNGFENSQIESDDVIIGKYEIDLSSKEEVDALEEAVTARIYAFASTQYSRCRSDKKKTEACKRYIQTVNKIKLLKRKKEKYVRVAVALPAPIKSLAPADCTTGLCYRIKQPFRVKMSVDGGVSALSTIMLPNRSPLIALDIDRAFLVQKVTTITFDEYGFLSQFDVKKPSELEELAKLPLEIVKAILEAPKTIIDLRFAQIDSQTKLYEKQKKLDEALTALETAQLEDKENVFKALSVASNLVPHKNIYVAETAQSRQNNNGGTQATKKTQATQKSKQAEDNISKATRPK